MIKKAALGLGLSLMFCNVLADTSIWKIIKGKDSLLLGGTFHMLAQSDLPLPEEYDQAYHFAEKLVFEVDQSKLSTLEVQTSMIQRMMLENDKTLDTVLKPETYNKLHSFLSKRGLDIASFNQFKPGFIALTISIAEFQRLGLMLGGVDSIYHTRSLKDNKPQGQLETVEQQIDFLANMDKGIENEIIINTMEEIDLFPTTIEQLKTAWRTGDMQTLSEVGMKPMQEEFPGVYQTMLVQRNNAWMPQIEVMLRTPEKELILVGALHLAGKDGLLALLSQKGYKVEIF